MSVIIEGMEMPKNCWLCPLSVLYEKPREMLRCKLTKEEVLREKIDGDCPLTELPPHGRLIDGDRLYGTIEADEEKTIGHVTFKDRVLLDIRGMPTIIEASPTQPTR